MDYGDTNTPSMHHRLGSTTLLQLVFPGEGNLNFLRVKFHCDNTVIISIISISKVLSSWPEEFLPASESVLSPTEGTLAKHRP